MDAGGTLSELKRIELFFQALPNAKYLAVKAQFDLSPQIKGVDCISKTNDLKLSYILERLEMFDLISGDKSKESDQVFHNMYKNTSSRTFNKNLICFNCGGYVLDRDNG